MKLLRAQPEPLDELGARGVDERLECEIRGASIRACDVRILICYFFAIGIIREQYCVHGALWRITLFARSDDC